MKKQRQVRLTESDIDLLARLQGEFIKEGIKVSDSDMMSMGIKQLESGGSVEALLDEFRNPPRNPAVAMPHPKRKKRLRAAGGGRGQINFEEE